MQNGERKTKDKEKFGKNAKRPELLSSGLESRLAYYGLFSGFLILSWVLREVAIGFNLFSIFSFFEVKDRKINVIIKTYFLLSFQRFQVVFCQSGLICLVDAYFIWDCLV